MDRGALVAAEARDWLGTKFVWQASQKQVGCDCKGLLWGVARELNFPEADSLYAKVSDYSPTRRVPSALMKEGFASIFDRVSSFEDRQLGDVLLLKISTIGPAGHVAIVSKDDSAIHAQIASKDWVKETKLRALLAVCPLVSIWRWRDGR